MRFCQGHFLSTSPSFVEIFQWNFLRSCTIGSCKISRTSISIKYLLTELFERYLQGGCKFALNQNRVKCNHQLVRYWITQENRSLQIGAKSSSFSFNFIEETYYKVLVIFFTFRFRKGKHKLKIGVMFGIVYWMEHFEISKFSKHFAKPLWSRSLYISGQLKASFVGKEIAVCRSNGLKKRPYKYYFFGYIIKSSTIDYIFSFALASF